MGIRLGMLASIAFLVGGPAFHAGADPASGTEPLPEMLVSRQLLASEKLSIGDVVSLSSERSGAGVTRFRIAGIYEPLPDPLRITHERHEVRLHLPDMLRLTGDPENPGDDAVSGVNVALRDPADADAFARDLASRQPFLMVRPTAVDAQGTDPFVVLQRFHLGIALVTVIGSTAFLLALMVMRAEERRETVGILRLIGFTRQRVMLEVFIEGVLVSVSGAVFGVLLAGACQDLFNRFFQWRYDTALIFVRISASIAWSCVALAVPLGILAGLAASWTLLRRETLTLLRR